MFDINIGTHHMNIYGNVNAHTVLPSVTTKSLESSFHKTYCACSPPPVLPILKIFRGLLLIHSSLSENSPVSLSLTVLSGFFYHNLSCSQGHGSLDRSFQVEVVSCLHKDSALALPGLQLIQRSLLPVRRFHPTFPPFSLKVPPF